MIQADIKISQAQLTSSLIMLHLHWSIINIDYLYGFFEAKQTDEDMRPFKKKATMKCLLF